MSTLLRCPNEILEKIGLELCLIQPHSPPRDLLCLSATCWRLRMVLWNSHIVCANVYRALFDYGAAGRRLDSRAGLPRNLSNQLRTRYRVLAIVRQGNIYDDRLELVFWAAFIMLTENDFKNFAHLEHAGLPRLVDRFVRERLYEGSEENDGWPVDNTINSLALWIMSMMMTPERLHTETHQERIEIINLVMPFVAVGFRYAMCYTPNNHFNLPLSAEALDYTLPTSIETAHGDYPIYRDSSDFGPRVLHSGCALTICRPLITLAAKHLFFARRELVPQACPPHAPLNRAAIEPGRQFVGPTHEDVAEFNAHKGAKLYAAHGFNALDSACGDSQAPSARWDYDWERMLSCCDPWAAFPFAGPVSPVGALNGLWGGRMSVPNVRAYHMLMGDPTRPANFSEESVSMTMAPIFMRLAEHHCINPRRPAPCGGAKDHFDDNLFNAWLPYSHIHRRDDHIVVTGRTGQDYIYESFISGKPNSHDEWTCTSCAQRRARDDQKRHTRLAASARMAGTSSSMECNDEDQWEDDDVSMGDLFDPELEVPPDNDFDESEDGWSRKCDGVEDIIITGSTDSRHGLAWGGFYSYYGRIRRWDGLIAILRVPTVDYHPEVNRGQLVFTGYLVGGTNIVGSWRFNTGDVGEPSWESAFTMSKMQE